MASGWRTAASGSTAAIESLPDGAMIAIARRAFAVKGRLSAALELSGLRRVDRAARLGASSTR